MSIQHALGLTGGPQKGLPQYQPTMPPTTRPTGPATTKPVPAPKTAPTLSACELVGPRAIIKIGAAASKVLRMVHSPVRLNVKSNIRGPDTQRGKRVGDFFQLIVAGQPHVITPLPGTRRTKCCDLGQVGGPPTSAARGSFQAPWPPAPFLRAPHDSAAPWARSSFTFHHSPV